MFWQGDDCEGGSFTPYDRSVPLSGDFYRENDDVARGITLSFDEVSSETRCFREAELEDTDRKKSAYPLDRCVIQACQKLDGNAVRTEFQPGDRPPSLDYEPSEVTKIFIEPDEAVPKKNALLHFLNEESTAHIKKVNRKKFTVKAEVLWAGLTCEIKNRAYQLPDNRVVFLFQRLRGDSIAFNGLFQSVKTFLTSGDTVQSVPLSLPAPAPVSQELSLAAECSKPDLLTPLIDAANRAEDTQAQAEAAAGLAAAAEDTGSVEQLCNNDNARTAIQKLLEVNCFGVSCQVLRLLVKLAVSQHTRKAFFQGKGFMEKVYSLATTTLWNDESKGEMRSGERRLRDQLFEALGKTTHVGHKGRSTPLSTCAEAYLSDSGVFNEAPPTSAGRW
mmetsp:Transcript_39727/g.91853  ORF Transcript_39727/g.91853 Transcript_39727/m.91853 type:complete len:389 (+) Transcript_39727:110-1276(+)